MNKLPSNVRRELIEKAKTASAIFTKSKKISLQSLATLNTTTTLKTNDAPSSSSFSSSNSTSGTSMPSPLLRLETLLSSSSSLTTLNSITSNRVSANSTINTKKMNCADEIDINGNNQQRQQGEKEDEPSSSNNTIPTITNTNITTSQMTEALLHEVQLRLAKQHRKCLDIMDQVSSVSSERQRQSSVVASQHNVKQNVVKAVNQPLSYYNNNNSITNMAMMWRDDAKRMEKERNDTLKELTNLEILHADTFALTHHLLSNDKPTLTRFSPADRNLLASTFEQIRSRHAPTVETLADVVINLRNMDTRRQNHNHNNDRDDDDDDNTLLVQPTIATITKLIESFLHERLAIQFLCDHYVGLHRGKPNGGIHVDCNLMDVVRDAVVEATSVCDANLGIAPAVVYVSSSSSLGGDVGVEVVGVNGGGEGCSVTLVRPYVHHALVELLKNAMASSVQRSIRSSRSGVEDGDGDGDSWILPPTDIYLRIIVVDNDDTDTDTDDDGGYISCEIIDQGIGLGSVDPHHHHHYHHNSTSTTTTNTIKPIETAHPNTTDYADTTAFKFTHTSSPQRWDRIEEQQSYATVRAPLGSLGVGLTSSRMMMRMFGGDVRLWNNSTRGSGKVLIRGTDDDDDDNGEVVVVEIEEGCTAQLILRRDASWWMGEYWKRSY